MPATKTTDTKACDKPVWMFTGARLVDDRPAQYVRGVPARDLTQDDIDDLTTEQRKQAKASGLYRDRTAENDARDKDKKPSHKPAEDKGKPAKAEAVETVDAVEPVIVLPLLDPADPIGEPITPDAPAEKES